MGETETTAQTETTEQTERYTIKVRRYTPESGEGAYWQEFEVELDPTLSVLDGLLQAKDREDGSLSVRCSCRAAICGSCGVKINGQSTLACLTQIGEAHEAANRMNGDQTTRSWSSRWATCRWSRTWSPTWSRPTGPRSDG